MVENNIYGKLIYKCGICGKEHFSVIERANCEIECVKKKEEENRQAEIRKKEAEYKQRKEEVDNAFNTAYTLREKFVADYGSYKYDWKSNSFDCPSVWSFLV